MSIDAVRNRWSPPPGRHKVSLGGSMTRFLKQRKGIQQTKQTKAMPTSNFYQFKYNFMPESVDTSKPGVIELTTRDITTVRVERASQQSDEVHVFRGKEEPAKEVECVLIYDPESGLYTLEKLDSSLILHHEGRGPPKVRQPSASPLPNTPSPAASTSKTEEDFLFREMESARRDGNDDDDNDEDIPLSATSRTVAEKARKAEPVRPPPPDTSSGKPKPKLRGSAPSSTPSTKSKPPKSSPLATTSAVRPAQPATVANSTPPVDKGKAPQVSARTIDVEEEVLEFGKPARQKVRSHMSPQPGPPTITLQSTTSSRGIALSSPGGVVSLPGPVGGQEVEDDEDEWDKVAGVGDEPSAEDDHESIFGDGDDGEEINIDAFAAEINEELGAASEAVNEEEIFGLPEEPRQDRRPISLNEYAGGEVVDDDDDYSSSSDESDDDD